MIEIKMVCECGLTVEEENCNHHTSGVYILYSNTTYICGDCGKIMKRVIVKTEITETETIVQEN